MAIKPSDALTRDCDRPELKGKTYRDAIKLNLEQDKAILDCTDRMRAIRK